MVHPTPTVVVQGISQGKNQYPIQIINPSSNTRSLLKVNEKQRGNFSIDSTENRAINNIEIKQENVDSNQQQQEI